MEMETSSSDNGGPPIPPERWNHLRKLLERKGPFCNEQFEASPKILNFLLKDARILVVGAGGLGCELLKNLALMGFGEIDVIDMDTIDISNLNRQFLFRMSDVGKSKAECAAEFINKRVQGAKVVPHHFRIQDKDESFYKQFHIVICGLDSVTARRWLNSMLCNLIDPEDPTSTIPLIDGGTEAFKGHARVILPKMNACIECTLDLFPPQVNYPLCTIASTPRLPEHCIEYVRLLQWSKENPFDAPIDGDDPNHINWVYEKACERAAEFGITGITYRLTQGVIKHITPAVASTNAVIAASLVTEAFKLATSCCNSMDNYMVFNDACGIYTFVYSAERKDDCFTCAAKTVKIELSKNMTVNELIEMFKEDPTYQMKDPNLTATVDGRPKTLFIKNIAATAANLDKSLFDLGLRDKVEIFVADETIPNTVSFIVNFSDA